MKDYVEKVLQQHREQASICGAEARNALNRQDYSEAATWSHRAHQNSLIVTALVKVLANK